MYIGLVLIALAFPLLELAVLIKVGQAIGFWSTVLLLALTSAVGGYIVYRQGLSAARRAMAAAAEGRPPVEPVVDSVLLTLAGMLLLLPGLISDVVALLLLVPPVRRALARWALSRLFVATDLNAASHSAGAAGEASARGPSGPRRAPGEGIVIEGEWERIDEPKAGPSPGGDKRPGQGPAR